MQYENEEAAKQILGFMSQVSEDIIEIKLVRDNFRGVEYRITLRGKHDTSKIQSCVITESNERFSHIEYIVSKISTLKDEPDIEHAKDIRTVFHVSCFLPPINTGEAAIYKYLRNLDHSTNPE
jgi:hypothetical protein